MIKTKVTSKSLVPLKKNVSVVAEQVKNLEINNPKDMIEATKTLSILNKYGDSIKEKKETLTKPLNTALRNARALFKPLEEIYEEAIETIRARMSDYQTRLTRIAKEEAEKIASRVAPGRGNLSLETAVSKIQAIDQPNKEVATDEGLVQFREVKQLKIVDSGLIPREYMIPDENKILEDLKNGKIISGCEIELIQVPVNYR